MRLPGDAAPVSGDAVRLAQVFANLLSNAAKYTPPGGRVAVTGRARGREAVVRVRDNGVGIDADVLPRIFDLFVQADATLDRAEGGLGIGLTLVDRLTAHARRPRRSVTARARARALSSWCGCPSTRRPRWPATGRQRPSRGQATRAPLPDRRRQRRRGRESLDVTARDARPRVRMSSTTADWRRAAARDSIPMIVLLDIGLPGMDGYRGRPAVSRGRRTSRR